ncbi:hypothetical protein Tco_0786664 [Tanacetum coccineum]
MSNNNLETKTSSALHNLIMEAGDKDHPPMLAPEENRKKIDAEAEAVMISLIGINNDIYYLVDALVSDEEVTPRDKEIEKLMALISMYFKKIYKPTNNNMRTSSNIGNKNVDNTPRFDERIGDSGSAADWDSVFQLQKIWVCSKGMQESKMDVEPHDQELEAHYTNMANIHEFIPNADDNSGPIFDTEPLEKILQICVMMKERDKERALLALLIAILKLEIDENKKISKDLKKENMSLNSKLTRYKESNYVKEADIEIAKAHGLLKEQNDQSDKYCSKVAFQKLSSIVDNIATDVVEFNHTLKEEMVAALRYFNSLEKEVESLQS